MKKVDMKKSALYMLAALLCLLFLTSCSPVGVTDNIELIPEPTLLPSAKTEKTVYTVQYQDVFVPEVRDCWVLPFTEEIAAPIDGTIEKILVHPGDSVCKGQKLASITHEEDSEQAEKLRQEIEYLQSIHQIDEEIVSLQEEKIIVQMETLMNSQSADSKEYRLKQIELEKIRLDRTHRNELYAIEMEKKENEYNRSMEIVLVDKIDAPMDGVISYTADVAAGDRISENDLIFCIADPEQLFLATEKISDQLWNESGKQAFVFSDGEIIPVEKQEIDTHSGSLFEGGGSGATLFKLPEEGKKKFTAGMYFPLVLKNHFSPDQLVVPENAVLSDSNGTYVYLNVDEKQEKQYITGQNIQGSGYCMVLSGLEEGDRIYVAEN